MGIDIYAGWRGQNEKEKEAQITGFDTQAGHVGYLREAYHGGPYVTKFLLKEAFDSKDGEAKISASVLRERLPGSVILAIYRHKKLYEGPSDPSFLGDIKDGAVSKLQERLKSIFEVEVKDDSADELSEGFTEQALDDTKYLIEQRALPKYALSFVDFVELCEKKEAETGEPCLIMASA